MHFNYISLTVLLGIAQALPGSSPSNNSNAPPAPSSAYASAPPTYTAPSWTPTAIPSWTTSAWVPTYTPPGGDCGDQCGGVCGDGILQAPEEECDLGVVLNNTPGSGCDPTCHKYTCGDGIIESPEECDAGALNGAYNSGCSTDCKLCGYCGDGIVDDAAGEECDDGWQVNGTPGSNCSATCQWQSVTCPCSCCYAGTSTGANQTDCEANCQAECTTPCTTCNPIPSLNFCDITTSCINTPTDNDYCACRAGYKADGLADTDPKQFRLAFPGQEYRVFVAPGVSCNTLCDQPFPGPLSCQEIPIQDTC